MSSRVYRQEVGEVLRRNIVTNVQMDELTDDAHGCQGRPFRTNTSTNKNATAEQVSVPFSCVHWNIFCSDMKVESRNYEKHQ